MLNLTIYLILLILFVPLLLALCLFVKDIDFTGSIFLLIAGYSDGA